MLLIISDASVIIDIEHGELTSAAEQLHIKVHGTIWLVEEMIKHNKISIDVARVGFQRMQNAGSRLPWHEVEEILKRNK